ncbi:MAG: hypothetical protein GC129_02275 [Proteobacteria bacterium]|nr:hypothetical protein [Pseudomonadota bacterium]
MPRKATRKPAAKTPKAHARTTKIARPTTVASPTAEGPVVVPGAENVAYKGAVPMKGFVGWVVLVLLAALLVGFMAAKLLVNQRTAQLVEETTARVQLQAQGRAAVVSEWAKSVAQLGDSIAQAEIVKLYIEETVKAGGLIDRGLGHAVEAQKPYMEQMLHEFVVKYHLSGAHIVTPDGQMLLSEGAVPEEMLKNKRAMAAVAASGSGTVLPVRMGRDGVVVDVLRAIEAPAVGESGPVVGILWFTMPVGEKLAELVAATPLDRAGERTAMLENVDGTAVVVGRTALAPLAESYMDLENRLDAGKVVQESVVDRTPVFASLKEIPGTQLALLQEYTADKALAIIGLYKPGLYLIVSLVMVVLAAMMLALTLHLMGQRNKTRVRLLGQTMEALVRVVEARDPYLAGHHGKVARLSVQVANAMRMGVGERATLFYAAQLAAVGRMLVPQAVLAKKGKLTDPERKALETHISQAVGILGDLDFDLPIASVIGEMYEREDGSGHPKGLKGSEISRMGKVLGACDAYVALTSARAHRSALGKEAALKAMGGQFNKDVLATIARVAR